MRILVLSPGALRHVGARALADDYQQRIQRLCPMERRAVRESRRHAGDEDRARREEAAAMLAEVPAGADLVALDAAGRSFDSDAFHRWLVGRMEAGIPAICFAIGGPEGHDPSLRDRARLQLSLSAMTLPHEIAEVILLEAIYRALMRWRGLPYHR